MTVVAGAAAVVGEAFASRAVGMVALTGTSTLSGLVKGTLVVDNDFLHTSRGDWHKVEKAHKEFRTILVTLYYFDSEMLVWLACMGFCLLISNFPFPATGQSTDFDCCTIVFDVVSWHPEL